MTQKLLSVLAIILLPVVGGMTACETDTIIDLENNSFHSIRGGEETNYESWTGVVALVHWKNGKAQNLGCTGTLIHPNVVLTAGHCVRLTGNPPFQPGFDYTKNPGGIVVKGGANVGALGRGGVLLSKVLEVIDHEDWNGGEAIGEGVDLALLRLDTNLESAGTYCLRQTDDVVDGDDAIIVGYGLSNTPGLLGGTTQGKHRVGYTTAARTSPHMFEITGVSRTCTGDSGGPMFTQIDSGQWQQTGVTSYGDSQCKEGGEAYSVNVSGYYNWISEQVYDWTGDTLGACTRTGSEPGTVEPYEAGEPDSEAHEDSGPEDTPDGDNPADTGDEVNSDSNTDSKAGEDPNGDSLDIKGGGADAEGDGENPDETGEETVQNNTSADCSAVPSRPAQPSLLAIVLAL